VYVKSNSQLRCCGVNGHLYPPGHNLQSSEVQLLLPGCPFCRKVREAITLLDLDVMIYPCPKGAVSWRGLMELCSSPSQLSLQ
jgi:Glutathione S-transferase, N-terminal domain